MQILTPSDQQKYRRHITQVLWKCTYDPQSKPFDSIPVNSRTYKKTYGESVLYRNSPTEHQPQICGCHNDEHEKIPASFTQHICKQNTAVHCHIFHPVQCVFVQYPRGLKPDSPSEICCKQSDSKPDQKQKTQRKLSRRQHRSVPFPQIPILRFTMLC